MDTPRRNNNVVLRRHVLLCLLVIAAAVPGGHAAGQPGGPAPTPAAAGAPSIDLNVMTFNIRYGTAPDGVNAWDQRKDMVVDTINLHRPQVLCLQEALRSQLDFLAESLPDYAEIGVGRSDGKTAGEYAAILYNKRRLEVVESGTFWLSDTPEVPGSKTWGNTIVRICTWARLREAVASCPVGPDGVPQPSPPPESRPAFWVFNVHLDHQSQASREKSVELVAARIASRGRPEEPVIWCGDFNAGETNPVIRYIKGEAPRASEGDGPAPASPRLVDTFRVPHPDETVVGTFNNFGDPADARTISGDKIDFIFVQPASTGLAEVLDAGIDRSSRDGRYPSDHFSVWARVRLRVGAGAAR